MLGGIHASLADMEEVKRHCDAVVVGEAEELVGDIIDDHRAGRLRDVYRASRPPRLGALPRPRFELLPLDRYFSLHLPVQTTRGCTHHCDFCSVRRFNGRPRRRPIREVVGEIEAQLLHPRVGRHFRGRTARLFFVDDHFCSEPAYTTALCEALIGLQERRKVGLEWIVQTTAGTGDNSELLRILARAGCRVAFIGFESVFPERLGSVRKTQNDAPRYLEQVAKFHAAGISVFAACIIGWEGETAEERRANLKFFRDRAGVEFIGLNVLMPFPGTAYLKTMRARAALKEDRYWLSEDLDVRLLPWAHLPARDFWPAYWRDYLRFYNGAHLGRLLWRRPGLVDFGYLKIFFSFWANARFLKRMRLY
jgi:radical SAM superfamily enzyme YgiQ (UPF0313 family)